MKIGIDARFLGTETGIGRYVFELVKHLDDPPALKLRRARELESENEFVVFLREENFGLFNPASGRIKKVLADIPWYGLKEQLEMPKIIAKENVDLMHFPHFNVPFFYNKPFVVTIHDLILLNYPSARATTLGPIKFFFKYIFYRLVIGHAIKKSKSIIVPSQFVKGDVLKNFKVNAEKLKVVYEGASFNCHYPAYSGDPFTSACHYPACPGNPRDCPNESDNDKYHDEKKQNPYFLYVGNAYPHKNLEGMIKAFEIFQPKADPPQAGNKKYNLVLIGKEDYFKKRLKKEFAGENIIFKSFVSDKELAEFYQNAEVYIFPSFSEGFGLPGIEAMAHGIPVLASNSSCLPEIYGDAAIYFDSENINEMAEKMEEIIGNKNLREELIKKGFEQIKKYDWKKCAEQTEKIYQETI